MATIQQLKTQIENANALGRTNLSEKGVELPETATTYEIMSKIAEISGGGVSLNIAYGETAPEDTSKLWIKANEPANVSVGSDIENVETYIESTGTQYIDTGVIPTNHRVKMKFQKTNSSNGSVFGSYGNKNPESNVYELVWYEGKWYYAPKTSYDYQGRQGSFLPGTGYYPTDVIELDFNTYENKILMNGIAVVNTYGESAAVLPMYLFSQSGNITPCAMKLWYAQIYDRATQTLVRDFVPAKDENGVVCLYDKVTQAYFYNQGEGVFGDKIITHELTQGNIEIQSSSITNKFNLINTKNTQVEIGVENVYIGNENNEAGTANAILNVDSEWKRNSCGNEPTY